MPFPTTIPLKILNSHDHWGFVLYITTLTVITHGVQRGVGKGSGTSLKNLGFSS